MQHVTRPRVVLVSMYVGHEGVPHAGGRYLLELQRLLDAETDLTMLTVGNRLNQAESEARETQCWLETTVECGYINKEAGQELFQLYNNVIGKLVTMENNPNQWLLKPNRS